MTRASWTAVLTLAALTDCAAPPPEQRFVNDVLAALGGKDTVEAAHVLDLQGDGVNYNLGQDMTPGAATQTFAITGYHRIVDLTAPRMRVEQTRTPQFAYFQGPQPQTQILALDGDVGYNLSPTGASARISAQVARDRRAELYHHPLVIARAMIAPTAKVANVRVVGRETAADVITADGVSLTVFTNSTGVPVRVASDTDHPNLGDVTISTTFAAYQDVAGLRLPTQITTRTDDFTTAEIVVRTQSVAADVPDLSGPANSPPAPVAPAPTVTADVVAKGVWFLGGQSHHSVLVEFADHLVLIESPLSEARTLAVIAKARELVPGKPLTSLVSTHHHFDHTAGLRAAIAEGLTVITQAGNKAFVETMATRPHTRQPDALQKNPKPVTVITVDDALELKDTSRTMMLYHIAGNPHSATMLMAYLPADKVLIEVDAFSPGAPVQPYAANLLENVTARRLKVDRIVPLHGAMAKGEDLAKAVPKTP